MCQWARQDGRTTTIDFIVYDCPPMEIQYFVDFDFVGMYLSRHCIEPFIPQSEYNIQFTKPKKKTFVYKLNYTLRLQILLNKLIWSILKI